MTIGIIGAGAIGSALARQLARAGLDAVLSDNRGPDSLADLVRDRSPTITAATGTVAS